MCAASISATPGQYFIPGLNWGPLACKASVITARPMKHREKRIPLREQTSNNRTHSKYSDAGTRTRVSWVRAKYPNQLDYIGTHASRQVNSPCRFHYPEITEAKEVLGGFEPPSLDSESRVLTVTPQDLRENRHPIISDTDNNSLPSAK